MDDSATPDLSAAIRRLGRGSVLVVGDAMLDRYIYGTVDRLSPEAPVPVLAVQREISLPGGAGNVVRNLGALGTAVAFVSVVGDDQPGSDLTGLIGGQPGVEPWLLVQGGRITTTKARFIAQGEPLQGHHLLRADREDTRPIHPKVVERMLRLTRDSMAATSVTILSDYRKGVLAEDLPARLIEAARQAGRKVVADLHGGGIDRYSGADVVMLAERELGEAAGAAQAAAVLRAQHAIGALLLVHAGDAMTLVDEMGTRHFGPISADVLDSSGVRDTIAAVLGAGLAAKLPLDVAVRLASLAAGVVMGRIGTAVARESDLLAAAAPHSAALRKIVPLPAAVDRVKEWRRTGQRTGFTHGGFDPLRPGHVHMLEQARGACDRLVVGLTGDEALRRSKGETRPLQHEAVRAARLASLPCVDLVVVHGDTSPAELLRALRPDVLVNGADRAPEDVAGAELLEEWGGRVMLAELLPEAADG